MKRGFKHSWLIIIVVLIILLIFLVKGIRNPADDRNYDEFAQCLNEKGAKIYGTDWCKYCQEQKKMFGDSFKLVNYVDCDRNREECLNEDIRGYPTWKINGESYSGVQPFERLAQLTECEL